MKRINHSSSLLPAVTRGRVVNILVDGRTIEAFEGEMVAAALAAAGIDRFRHSARRQQPRGIYCGMGICYECLVTVNGVHAQRACITPVADGMQIETCKELAL